MSLFVEIHALQPLGPNCINRDDTNTPKTVLFGGAVRARVSSQAWKRAIREGFRNDPTVAADSLSMRTKKIVQTIASKIQENHPDVDQDAAIAATLDVLIGPAKNSNSGLTLTSKGKDKNDLSALYFIGAPALNTLADKVYEAIQSGDAKAWGKKNAKDIKKLLKDDHAVDVSLFGRMAASSNDLNVDATCQVAHAISVDESTPEADYYTAVDDLATSTVNDEGDITAAGAGFLDVNQFTTPTFLRYAVVNATNLADADHLGDNEKAAKAIRSFIRAFAMTLPTGKQNAYASNSLPVLIYVAIKDSTPNNLVTAFQKPVPAPAVKNAVSRLVEAEEDYRKNYNIAPKASWVVRIGDDTSEADKLGEHVTLDQLLENVETTVEANL